MAPARRALVISLVGLVGVIALAHFRVLFLTRPSPFVTT
jgi:hypothetical protein